MYSIIISGFPGIGKSFCTKECSEYKILDLNIDLYMWKLDEYGKTTHIRNNDFPNNYIRSIVDSFGEYDFIFISTNTTIRNILGEMNIGFVYIVPSPELKSLYMKTYIGRGDSDEYLSFMNDTFESQINLDMSYKGTYSIQLNNSCPYLCRDILNSLKLTMRG